MSSYLDRVRKDRKRGRLPYRDNSTFRVVPEDEYVPPDSPVVVKETWDQHEARRRAKRRKSLMGTSRMATTIPMREPLPENDGFSIPAIPVQNKENIPLGTEQEQSKEIAKPAPSTLAPSLSPSSTQQDNLKAPSVQQQSQDDQDQIAANTSHSPPAEMIQQDENAESSEEELSIRFDMDIEEEEQAPIVDKAAETNNHDQEMAAVTQKPTSSPKEKTPPVADEIVSTAQEKEVAELDQKMESPEKPASPSKGKDVEAPSKDVPSPEKQITNADEAILQTENNAITPESDASGTDQMVIDQEEHIQEEHIQEDDIQEKDIQEKDIQDNIQQDNIQQENIQQESAANEPMPYVDDDNYSIDYYDPGEYDQVEPEHNDKQPNPPAEASSRDKGKRRAVEINTGQSTPPRQFGDDALEQKQIIINWLRVKRNVEHTKKLKSVKIALAILECVLSVVYLTAREARDKVTTLQEQYNIEVFYENYRIFMEQQESIIIKRRQAISHYKHVKGLLQQKREEEMKSRMKLNNLKRDVEKKGKELDKIKGKYDQMMELENIFSRIKNKAKRSPSTEE